MLKLERWQRAVILMLFLCSCAKKGAEVAKPMQQPEVITFKAFAYIAAEGANVRWSDNAAVIIKHPGGLRIEAIEKISDVVAVISAKGDDGRLFIPSSGKKYPFKKGHVRLPKIGDIPISAELFASLLIGKPSVSGAAQVSESFHTGEGSYFVNSANVDMEMSAKEQMPLVYTKYEDAQKKRIAVEASFDEMTSVGGKKFPRHVVIRFEHPKLVLDIRYKEIQTGMNIPWGIFE